MSNATPVSIDKESVRMLALEVGVRQAARQLGLSEDRVRNWSSRYNWLQASSPHRTTPLTPNTPGDILQATLAARKQESRAKLSEYQVRAASEAAAHAQPLSITRQVNDLASIHAKVWPEDQTNSNAFTLNVLNMGSLDVDIETPSESE
jgi:hypothetical protein